MATYTLRERESRAVAVGRTDEERASEIMRWARKDMDRWSTRNSRFQRDEELYRLKTAGDVNARNKADIITSNAPRVIIKKLSRLLARHPALIDKVAAPGTDPDEAQTIENWLYIYDQAVNMNWMDGLHHPYRYDQAFYQVLRGWTAARTLIRVHDKGEDIDYSDPLWFLTHELFDPANVYPFVAGGRICRVTHAYTATVEELYEDPYYTDAMSAAYGELSEERFNKTATANVHCCYWESEGTWYHAVICTAGLGRDSGQVWIKKPTEIGYNPWDITIGQGSAYQRTPWSDIDYLEECGVGALDDNADLYKYENRMLTKLNEMLSLEVNPPITAYVQNGQIKTMNFYPGARNFLTIRDKIDVHKFGPQANDYKLLWDALQERIARATLPPAFFAEYGGETGFSSAILMAAGKDILFPFTEALNMADRSRYVKALVLYRDFGPSKPLRSQRTPNGLGMAEAADVTADMIKSQGTRIDVTREDMTPQEMIQRINAGLAMVREKAISLEHFRKEYAKLRNPMAENLKVLAEQVYLSEDVIKTLIPMALTSTGQEHLRRVWEMVQNPLPGPEGTPGGGAGLPPGPGGPQGAGAPPGPPGAQPPGAPPGIPMPPGAMPPIAANPMLGQQPSVPLGGGLPLPPGLLQMIQGGAQGGMGAGGLPPPAGTTNPVVPFIPRIVR